MKMKFCEAVSLAQKEEMQRDADVFVLGEDVGYFNGGFFATKGLFTEFGGERVLDTPISEAGIVGAAFGAALAGLRPIAEVQYMEFLGYMDPIVNHVAKTHFMSGGKINVPMVIRLPSGGKGGNASPHSQYLEAFFMHTPGLYVAIPSNPNDAKGLLKTAVRDDNPVVFVEEKLLYMMSGEVEEGDICIPFGVAKTVRTGADVTIVALGYTVSRAQIAASRLEEEGINVEIIDPRTLNPFDLDAVLCSIKKTGRLIIAHQACKKGGVGGEIAAMVAETGFEYLKKPIIRVASVDAPIAYNMKLEFTALPSEDDIMEAVRSIMK